MEKNIHKHEYLNHKNKPVIWLTGLSASGKSTIANKLETILTTDEHTRVKVLDGDNMRLGLNSDLGFTNEDRKENIRRIAEVSKLFSENNTFTITAFISPFIEDRSKARNIIGNNFIEVFVKTPLDVCEKRDPKGLYKKVRNNEIKNFTGIDSPYEEPLNPEITLDTTQLTIDECVQTIINYLSPQWDVINYGNLDVKNNGKQKAVFIGRYQPYHYGHIKLIEQKLNKDVPVLIMVRDIPPDNKNPFTTEQTINMIKKYHKSKNHNVEVISISDIESINYGRGVGYEVNQYTPPKIIENISATFIRESINNNDNKWIKFVDESIQSDVVKYLNEYSN